MKLKAMKLKTIKKIINAMDEKELEQELNVISPSGCESGTVQKIEKAKCDYYWNYDDDPSIIKKKREIDKDEFGDYEVYIKKGSFIIRY